MDTPYIIGKLQYLRAEHIVQSVINATELILNYLFLQHRHIFENIGICIREENMVDLYHWNDNISIFIIIDPEEVVIDRCTMYNQKVYHFQEEISINDIDELFIKKFQYVIYNANISNQI